MNFKDLSASNVHGSQSTIAFDGMIERRARRRHDSILRDASIRACDIALSAVAIIFFAPLLFVLGLCIYASDPGPILFGHKRIGKDGRVFRCLKFRSMVMDADRRLEDILAIDPVARMEWQTSHKLTIDPRITPLGNVLRKSSLDELPQLFNILRGDMSLVGPRPIVVEETWRYGRYLRHYLNARPGLTGLWQVSGRSNTTYRRRVALDVAWCRSRRLHLYWAILLRTIPAVLMADGSA